MIISTKIKVLNNNILYHYQLPELLKSETNNFKAKSTKFFNEYIVAIMLQTAGAKKTKDYDIVVKNLIKNYLEAAFYLFLRS